MRAVATLALPLPRERRLWPGRWLAVILRAARAASLRGPILRAIAAFRLTLAWTTLLSGIALRAVAGFRLSLPIGCRT